MGLQIGARGICVKGAGEGQVRIQSSLGLEPLVGHHGQVDGGHVGPKPFALLLVAHGSPLLVVVYQQHGVLWQRIEHCGRVVTEVIHSTVIHALEESRILLKNQKDGRRNAQRLHRDAYS